VRELILSHRNNNRGKHHANCRGKCRAWSCSGCRARSGIGRSRVIGHVLKHTSHRDCSMSMRFRFEVNDPHTRPHRTHATAPDTRAPTGHTRPHRTHTYRGGDRFSYDQFVTELISLQISLKISLKQKPGGPRDGATGRGGRVVEGSRATGSTLKLIPAQFFCKTMIRTEPNRISKVPECHRAIDA